MSEQFDQLSDFLRNQMRMSHIYQPAMLIRLLQNGGRSTISDIAKAILVRDPSQVEHYEEIVRRQPGRVLTDNRGLTKRVGNTFYLNGFDELSPAETETLIEICKERLNNFLNTRRSDPWKHRRKSSGYIPGSSKYEVLKRARMRCQLCGISALERALEVDHIVPRKFLGRDDISNLQALCYSCNGKKGASDDADLREVVERYDDREEWCVFCDPQTETLSSENSLSYSIPDPSPISAGHMLIVPKRHVADYFDLYQPELNSIDRILNDRKQELQASDVTITGFNVGFDSGIDAGQTNLHCYLQLIPRRSQDCVSRRGGLREVIPKGPNSV